MAVFSTLRNQLRLTNVLGRKSDIAGFVIKRYAGGGDKFIVKGSNFNWMKVKDLFSFYTCVAALLYGSIILYANIFIGSATLAEIPEGYRPKHWEYYSHPISRFFQRYCFTDPQMEHEKILHEMYEEDERKKMIELDAKIEDKIKRKKDYQAFYYRPLTSFANYIRHDYHEEKLRKTMAGYTPGDMHLPVRFEESPEGGELETLRPDLFGTGEGSLIDAIIADFQDYPKK